MEDAIVAEKLRNWSVFAVLDGHGGSECSEIVSKNLRKFLDREMGENTEDQMGTILFKTFQQIDKELCSNFQNVGSTCTMVVITGW